VQRLEGRVEEGTLSQETVFYMMSEPVTVLKLPSLYFFFAYRGGIRIRFHFGRIDKVSSVRKQT
jgi:hypothetical protein